jgi:hypothetical protein
MNYVHILQGTSYGKLYDVSKKKMNEEVQLTH